MAYTRNSLRQELENIKISDEQTILIKLNKLVGLSILHLDETIELLDKQNKKLNSRLFFLAIVTTILAIFTFLIDVLPIIISLFCDIP